MLYPPALYDHLPPSLAHPIREADTLARRRPGDAYHRLATAAETAGDPFEQALLWWHAARMANEWVHPRLVEAAVAEARARFTALDRPEWLAACDWQANAVPWTRPNFGEATATLARALAGMAAPSTAGWQPYARLSLAYARLLAGHYEQGMADYAACEAHFRQANLPQALGRCLVGQASGYRRRRRFAEAERVAAEALAILRPLPAPVDTAHARYRLGNILLMVGERLDDAEILFQQALDAFREADIPLWVGQCLSYGLSRLYRDRGEIAAAGQALEQAAALYAEAPIPGLRGDNLLDLGKFLLVQGRLPEAERALQQAHDLYQSMNHPFMPWAATMYLAQVDKARGRLQSALARLEEANHHFKQQQELFFEAECDIVLGNTWLELNRPQRALEHLEAVRPRYEQQSFQLTFWLELNFLYAYALFRCGRPDEAMAGLEALLASARAEASPPNEAGVHYYLGQMLARSGRPAAARQRLQTALDQFEQLGLPLEAGRCLVALGRLSHEQGEAPAARAAWERALQLARAHPPTLWQAHAGLAALAADPHAALVHYHEMAAALGRVRRGFWQPALAGHFSQQPAALLQKAAALAAALAEPDSLLTFIELGKAATLPGRLTLAAAETAGPAAPYRQQLETLEASIRALQNSIQQSVRNHPGFLRPAAEQQQRERLQQEVQAYDRLLAQAQRSRLRPAPGTRPMLPPGRFDHRRFRQQAATALPGRWVALDNLLAGEAAYLVVLTADDLFCRTLPIPWQVAPLLAQMAAGDRQECLVQTDQLAPLGDWLLPPEVLALLDEETTLIVAPHDLLHRLPWAALGGSRPLVARCLPLLAPSLETLALLWQRAPAPATPGGQADGHRPAGLLLAVADFDGRHAPLPSVEVEAARLLALPGLKPTALIGADATWDALQRQAGDGGLAAFEFWHLATHAFYDNLTGRLSAIALADRDVWADRLWQLAPLPPLLSLSACSGTRSKLYQGDEPEGLLPLSLAAGAQCVVGSLYPVRDTAAARLMATFYEQIAAGTRPAPALAHAQRQAHTAGAPWAEWGHFVCVGSGM